MQSEGGHPTGERKPLSEATKSPAIGLSVFTYCPPSMNNLFYTDRRTGTRHKSGAYRTWIKQAIGYSTTMAHGGRRDEAIAAIYAAPVAVEIVVRRPDKRRRDVTNYVKALDDLLVRMGILKDDCQIGDSRIRWANDSDRMPSEVVITVRAA